MAKFAIVAMLVSGVANVQRKKGLLEEVSDQGYGSASYGLGSVGLASLMGCDSKVMGTTLKKNYNKIFVETNMQPASIEANINAVVSQNNVCGA